jgi:hypothetical protein
VVPVGKVQQAVNNRIVQDEREDNKNKRKRIPIQTCRT